MAKNFEFMLGDYYPWNFPVITELIESGELPFDTMFRLAAVGCRELDPQDDSKLLQWAMIRDITENGTDLASLREDTVQVLYGELPDLAVDMRWPENRKGYPELDQMYYTLGNMARHINEHRKERGITIHNPMITSYYSDEERVWKTSVGSARPLWRTLVKRIRPEVVDEPQRFFVPTISFNHVYSAGERYMVRTNVINSVISDSALLEIYQESVDIGVRGVGPFGREVMRLMLLDEHPELHEGHESPGQVDIE